MSSDSDVPAQRGLQPLPANRPAVVVYICADDPEVRALCVAWCQQQVEDQGWRLSEVVTDTDELTPLIERPGWQRVTQLVSSTQVGVVLTHSRRMVAADRAGWERLTRLMQGLGVVLTLSNRTTAVAGEQP